ncbi:YfkD family protein [Natribacillus halophilus]|uniref:YfkD-like protein n=1 Tax=Natribacillus halophilus TaxID=549003 RepID=A0A1G8R428_9BACI|nr:YfkD family protein [Natribacillus halophilus]SDJ11744.1 YfkD-like protein [Natribacillus halophilus]
MKGFAIIATIMLLSISSVLTGDIQAAETEEDSDSFTKPDHVYNITRENTYSHTDRELPELEPSELTKDLQETADVNIDNPELVSLLNESTIKDSKIPFGVNASIYLGTWALNYDSGHTEVNWEYENINANEQDNRGGDSVVSLQYKQGQNKEVAGELNSDVPQIDGVKNLMRMKATDKTSLPLSFNATIGQGTEVGPNYQVEGKKLGVLHGYVPAVHEEGTVTYGEVYVKVKGTKRSLEVKNIEKQAVDGWIPVKDHVALKYSNG